MGASRVVMQGLYGLAQAQMQQAAVMAVDRGLIAPGFTNA